MSIESIPQFDADQQSVVQEQPQVKEKTKASEKKSPIVADVSGVIKGTTLEEQWRLATAYYNSGLFPQALDSVEKVLVVMQFLYELGLPVVTSMGKVAVINGTPSMFGDLPLSLVMRSGLLTSIKETVEDKDGQPFIGRCVVKRKGMDEPFERFFTMDEAKKAGLIDKTRSVWKVYPKRMLQMRARSWALKDAFPDVLNGAPIAEYDFDTIPDNNTREIKTPINVTPAEKLMEKLSEVQS